MDAVVEERWRGQRRERILEAAARVFSRLSYEAASMDGIAHEAGVGKPTLYRYFGSKDDLFAAVFVEALDELEQRLQAVLERESAAHPLISGLVVAIVPLFRDHLVPLRLLDEKSAAASSSKRRIFRERRARIGGYLARAVGAGARSGELRDLDGTIVAQLLLGMIWSATASGGADDLEIARHVTDMALNGLLPRGGEPPPRTEWPRRTAGAHVASAAERATDRIDVR